MPRLDPFEVEAIKLAMENLVRRAFRRPPTSSELERFWQLFAQGRNQDLEGPEAAILMVQALLVSPQFLFRLEEGFPGDTPPPDVPSTPSGGVDSPEPASRPLDSHALASRLAFFLWSRLPDQELMELADQGSIQQDEVLVAQVRRMLKHPHAQAFVENFVGQWLELRQLEKVSPDPEKFPHFTPELRQAMIDETKLYVQSLIASDGSLLDMIDSNYTYANEVLAKHYQIEGIQGTRFERVSLPDDRRGGIVTHASILTLSSNPTRTSPVKRGKWILENILGTPPPAPPPNVPELAEGDQELLSSLRERMEQHRENPSCAVCHRKWIP